MEKEKRDHAFTLRLWMDGAEGDPWRAVVMHVASGERRYFTNYGELCEFLDRFVRRSPARDR